VSKIAAALGWLWLGVGPFALMAVGSEPVGAFAMSAAMFAAAVWERGNETRHV
jgi:hypothetical protein